MKKILIAFASIVLLAGCSSQPTNYVPQPDQCVRIIAVKLQKLPSGKIEHAKPGENWVMDLNTTKNVVYLGDSYIKVNCQNPVDGHYVCNNGDVTQIINTNNESWSSYVNLNRSYGNTYISPIAYPTTCPRT